MNKEIFFFWWWWGETEGWLIAPSSWPLAPLQTRDEEPMSLRNNPLKSLSHFLCFAQAASKTPGPLLKNPRGYPSWWKDRDWDPASTLDCWHLPVSAKTPANKTQGPRKCSHLFNRPCRWCQRKGPGLCVLIPALPLAGYVTSSKLLSPHWGCSYSSGRWHGC